MPAWLMAKVTAPVVGATKLSQIDGAVKAVELKLTEDEIAAVITHVAFYAGWSKGWAVPDWRAK